MSDLKQNVNYEVTLDDKTGPGTDSALANLLKQEKASKEANNAARQEAQNSHKLFGAITQALSGNFEALGMEITKAVAKLKGFKLSGMALGAIGLTITAIVTAAKALADAFKSAQERLDAINAENFQSTMKSLDDGAKRFADEMARARKESELQRKVFDDDIQSIRDMAKAENEFARQRALALAKSPGEREKINRTFAGVDAENETYLNAQSRARDIQDAEAEIERIKREISENEEDQSSYGEMARESRNKIASLTKRVGWWDSFKFANSVFSFGSDVRSDLESAGAELESVSSREQEAAKKGLELQQQLIEAEHRLQVAREKDEIAYVEAAAADQKDLNEEWQRADEEREKAEVAAVEHVADVKAKAEETAKQARLANIAEAEQAEKDAAAESAAANARLAAAQARVQQAWGWYRNKDSMAAQLAEEKANAEAERQYEKDFQKLKDWHPDWETAKNLSVDDEAVRRVALAKREEDAAQKAVEEIDAKMDQVVEHLAKMTAEEG